MTPKWEILILTMPGRERFLARLLACLKPQLEQVSDVTVTIRVSDKNFDLGTNRRLMLEAATGEYVNFVDDDDLVPAHYIATIHPLLDGVDYIGHRLQYFVDGAPQKPTIHSLRYKTWNADDQAFYRDISHVNPIRRELALRGTMSGGIGEDERWGTSLREKGLPQTEHFVDEVMYLYYWRSNKELDPFEPGQVLLPVEDKPRPQCPICRSTATSLAGGMRRCNQCGASW
jgi:glycosyltransferase involved in cell wall biosynthesis